MRAHQELADLVLVRRATNRGFAAGEPRLYEVARALHLWRAAFIIKIALRHKHASGSMHPAPCPRSRCIAVNCLFLR